MKKGPSVHPSDETYRQLLLEKRKRVLSGLGTKFDTLARLGRVAEDDQAQISHEEFISLKMNSLDYSQLRLVQEALDRLEGGVMASASPVRRRSPPNGCWQFPGRAIALNVRTPPA